MVEQVRISPEEVRGYGNICEEHSLDDFIVSSSGLAKEKETVHGALTEVYKLVYSLYGLIFDFDKGNKQLYLQMAEADTLTFGFDDDSKQLYLVDEGDTGFNLGFDEDTNELYITDEAPPSISISASSPYLLSGETTDLIVTLYDGVGTPLANESVTVSDGTSVYTGITNNNGTYTKTGVSVTDDTTFTATYGTVSDSCLVEYCIFADYNDPNNYIIRDTTTSNCSLENGVIKIANTSNGNASCFVTLNSDAITGNFKVIYDLQTSSTVALYQRIGTTRTGNNANVNGDVNHTTFKKVEWILQDGTMTVKIDGTTWKTTTYSSGTYYPIFGFYFNVGEYVYIRNLRIKAL